MAEILNIPVRTPFVLDNTEEKNFLKTKYKFGYCCCLWANSKKDILEIPK